MEVVERGGWVRSSEGVAYPPEPWYLGGDLRGSTFRVPLSRLPAAAAAHVPPDHAIAAVRGNAIVNVAFAHYVPGGVLQYDELLVAVAVRHGRHVRFSIPLIWVTSESSMHGGRELWGIPKHIGDFTRSGSGPSTDTSMRWEGDDVARLVATDRGALLPGRRRIPLPTAQLLDGRSIVSTNLVLGRVRGLRAAWEFAPDGPLGFLAGATPAFSTAITDAAVSFGLLSGRAA